jgi:hypothetical protein
MNVTLLAASALLVQSGALLVFFNFFAIANPRLHRTSRPPIYFNNTGGTSMEVMTSILPLKRLTDH